MVKTDTQPIAILREREFDRSVLTSALLERDESGGVSGTDTGATVLDGLVSDGEFAEVVTDHLGLDFNLCDVNEMKLIKRPRKKTN